MAVIRIQGQEEIAANIHYEVDSEEKELGTGGMGQVRRGVRVDHRNGLRTEVAIKFLFDDLPPSTIDRARREASIRIQNDNVVNMLGFIEIEDQGTMRYHVVSELLRGVMLYDILNGSYTDSEGNTIEMAQRLIALRQSNREAFALTIFKGVLAGVTALHDKGYVHRDIDPSNIMVTSDGKIKLLDFGIAKQLDDSGVPEQQKTTAGVFMGKAAYAAPELVLGDTANQDETTDIYSLGIMLFQLLTGHLPFEGPANEVMQKQCKEKLPLKEISDKELRKIVGKATEKKQSERYRSVSAMRVAMEEAERSLRKTGSQTNGRIFTSSGDSRPSATASGLKSAITTAITDSPKPKKKLLIGIASAIAMLAIAGGVGVAINHSNKEKENRRQLAEQSRIDSLENARRQRELELQSKSWAERIEEPTAPINLAALIAATEGEGKNSAEAAYLYGGILSRQSRVLPEKTIDRYSSAHPEDLMEAHLQFEKALKADSSFYKASYEAGYDYAVGRGTEVDLEKASSMMKVGLQQAKAKGDAKYVDLFESAIEKIGL